MVEPQRKNLRIACVISRWLLKERPGSIPGQSMWDSWWIMRHLADCFREYFAFSMSTIIPSMIQSIIDHPWLVQ
jgi:hypothetical protein